MSGEKDLKPCPFCGQPAEIYQMNGGIRVGCGNAQCAVEAYTYGIEPHKSHMIEDWNTRATPPGFELVPEGTISTMEYIVRLPVDYPASAIKAKIALILKRHRATQKDEKTA